ncbi:hypothetical protein HYV79_01490 [Candidatus Woesearchaeota archaeon]|nr:hypothetical protein [Candidatus Woesearchaeota archaeon]
MKLRLCLKQKILSSILSFSILTGCSSSKPKLSEVPTRSITTEVRDTLSSMDALSKNAYSIEQIIGKGTDIIDSNFIHKAGVSSVDDEILFRLGVLGLHSYTSTVISYVAHEAGHNISSAQKRKSNIKFDFSRSYHDILFPEVISNFDSSVLKNSKTLNDDFLFIIESGLNVQENISELVYHESFRKKQLSYDESLFFLQNKFYEAVYILRNKKIKSETLPDPAAYIELLKQKEIKINRNKLLAEELTAGFFSFTTWESVVSIKDYLLNSKNNHKPELWKIGDNDLTPPIISHFWAPDGTYYSITSIINPYSKHSLILNLGADLDFIQDGRMNTRRLGGEYVLTINRAKIKPFGYANFEKSGNWKGDSTGLEIEINKSNHFFSARAEWNYSDVIENTIKGKEEGVYGTFGYRLEF